MAEEKPTLAYLTAGAAGMFCGSCLRDNTLAAGMMKAGWDVHLIPTYTPIRTDEQNVADPVVLYGGLNVYLQQKLFLFRYLPTFLDRWLDNPRLINWLASRGIETDARQLGALTVSILRGEKGNQAKEVRKLTAWLEEHVKPDVINLSNILIAGCVPALKRRFGRPIVVTLQGDDIFLNQLPEPYRTKAMEEIYRISQDIDCYVTFSEYYRDYMSDLLKLPREKFRIVQLGIRVEDFAGDHEAVASENAGRKTIGYLARICPEKGLHLLCEAFRILRKKEGTQDVHLRFAGWLGKRDEAYFQQEVQKLTQDGLREGADADFYYAGVIDRQQKVSFLRSLDVLSVPTTYQDPKGLFVLEALASGVPVVQPEHGAFPELLRATGGGAVVRPNDPVHLAETLHCLLTDDRRRQELADAGRATVHQRFDVMHMTQQTVDVYNSLLSR